MDKVTDTDATAGASDIEALDALLEDLEVGEADSEPVEEEVVVEASDEIEDFVVDETDLNVLEAEMTREEVYAEQASEIAEADPDAPVKAQADKPARKAKGAGSKKASTPRTPRDLEALAADIFVLEGDPVTLDQAALDANKAAVIASKPEQRKIAEKFENLFVSLAAGRKPSNYVVQAFRTLDKNGTLTSAELVSAYRAPGAKSDTEGYDEGTARSQTGQILALFDTVKIAERQKQTLTLNKDSVLAQKLRTLLA